MRLAIAIAIGIENKQLCCNYIIIAHPNTLDYMHIHTYPIVSQSHTHTHTHTYTHTHTNTHTLH